MSYFPCDIPYMSEEELEEKGIKIPKDDKFETYWNTVEKATELADKLKMEIAEADEWDTALAIVDEELRPILAGLQLIDMKDEARKARLKELAEVAGRSNKDLISREETMNAIENVAIGYDISPFMLDRRLEAEKYADWLKINKVIFQYVIEKLPPAQQEEDWIPVDKDMPDEYDSVFTKFHGTDKWRDGMWLKSSAKVLVTVEFEDGTRLTETAKTIDGKWATENRIRKRKVVAWKKMPEEYKGK